MSADLYLENNKAINPKPSFEIANCKCDTLSKCGQNILQKFIIGMAHFAPLITAEWKGGKFYLKGDDIRIISFLINKGLIEFSQRQSNEISVLTYPWIDIPVSTSKILESQLRNACEKV